MANTWITSDLHFFHKRIMEFCPETRPWADVAEMTHGLMDAWNSTVKSGDSIYFLGDFSFGKREETEAVLRNLNGQKFLVLGNHDQALREGWAAKYFAHRNEVIERKLCGEKVVMCHFPMAQWNRCHHGSLHAFGHCHGNFQNVGRSMDVGWDAHGKILHIEEFVAMVNDRGVVKHHHKAGMQE